MAAATLSAATDSSVLPTSGTLSVTSNQATGTIYAIVTESATTPSHAQIVAGTDENDDAAAWADTDATPSAGANAFTATGLERDTTYYAHFTQVNGGAEASTPISGNGFTTTAAAILASIEQTRHGSTTMLVDIDTDLGDGVMYVVLTTSTTPPSAAQILTRDDNAGADAPWGTFFTPVAGVNQIVAAGLTPNTAYWAYAAQAVSGDNSNVADSSTSTTTLPTSNPRFIRPLITGVYS